MNFSIVLLLCIACIDYIGIGLVYPLFSSMLFSETGLLLHEEMSTGMRGAILGLLLGLAPMVQFFVSPYLGRLSDRYGRKPALLGSVLVGAVGYFLGWLSIQSFNLLGLIVSRAFIGVSSASSSIVNAATVDISTERTRARNFNLLCSAYGVGFTIGPMLGGILASSISLGGIFHVQCLLKEDPSRPFFVAMVSLLVSFYAIKRWFVETAPHRSETNEGASEGDKGPLLSLTNCIFLSSTFLFCFGWSLYWELISTAWVSLEHATIEEVGFRYAYGALWYSVVAVTLVQYLVSRFAIHVIFYAGCLLLSISIALLYFLTAPLHLLWLIPLQQTGIALLYPSALANISCRAEPENQGTMMGLHSSCVSLAFAVSPLIAGPVLSMSMYAPVFLGSVSILSSLGVFSIGTIRATLKAGHDKNPVQETPIFH